MSYISNVTIAAFMALLASLGIGNTGTSQLAAISGTGSGLVSQWTFDEGSGTTASDSSGSGNNGTLTGSTLPTWVTGKLGQSLSFDSNSAYVSIAKNTISMPSGGGITVTAWVKTTDGFGCIVSLRDTNNDNPVLDLCLGYNGIGGTAGHFVPLTRYDDASNLVSFTTTQAINNDAWHFVVAVVDQPNNLFYSYIDGAAYTQPLTADGTYSFSGKNSIGTEKRWIDTSSQTQDQRYITGSIDDVRIYNRALSSSEISELYSSASNSVAQNYTLFITKSGEGSGTVSGGTINCGSTCSQSSITPGTSITFTATPTSGSSFTGWSGGGCSGTGTCTVSLSSNTNITATFGVVVGGGATINAASCSQADVQSAINSSSAGGIVNIPAGTCTWGTGGSSLSVNKKITVMGAGPSNTIINISPSAPSWGGGAVGIYSGGTVGGFTINQSGLGGNTTAFSTGGSNGWRITNVVYNPSTGAMGYFVYAGSYGLIDNCTLNGVVGNDEPIFSRGPTNSWQTPSSMGTADAVYVEDTIFNGPGYVNDFNSNARGVVRFSTINGARKVDAHGKMTNSPPRGSRQIEVYNNTWTWGGSFAAMEIRGGTGRLFSNQASSASAGLLLNEYYAVSGGLTPSNWPIDDQIGVGQDPKSGGSEPMYIWNNFRASTIWPISLGYGNADKLTGVINPDRDYFIKTSSFNGTSGVGMGTKAEMNAITPTKVGVGYWVTNEGSWNTKLPANTSGVFYVWNGSSWVLNYIPYTYPHPLRTGSTVYPVTGICSSTRNQCNAGSFSDVTDSSSQYLWQCLGSNGGSNNSCSLAIPVVVPVTGICSSTRNQCSAGSFSDVTDSSSQYLWQCLGSNGGSNNSCSLNIPVAIVTPTNPTTPGNTTPTTPTTPTIPQTPASPSEGSENDSSPSVSPSPTVPTISPEKSQLAQLIELFISLGIIKQDKVRSARSFVTSSQVTVSGGGTIQSPVINNTTSSSSKFTVPMDIGARNSEVTALQTYLISQGLLFTKATGYFGPATAKAVGLFQERYNLAQPGTFVYGFVGPMTRMKLNELVK